MFSTVKDMTRLKERACQHIDLSQKLSKSIVQNILLSAMYNRYQSGNGHIIVNYHIYSN